MGQNVEVSKSNQKMSILDRIKGVFNVRLEDDEEVLLDERLGLTPSVVVGFLLYILIVTISFIIMVEFSSSSNWSVILDINLIIFYSVWGVLWLFLGPDIRIIVTNKKAIFKKFFVRTVVPLESFKEIRGTKPNDLLILPSNILGWFIILPSLVFKDIIAIDFSSKYFTYVGIANRDIFIKNFKTIVERHAKKRDKEEKTTKTIIAGLISKNNLIPGFLILMALYLFFTNGFLAFIFAEPADLQSLNEDDVGKYVVTTSYLGLSKELGTQGIGETAFLIVDNKGTFVAMKFRGPILEKILIDKRINNEPVRLLGKIEKSNGEDYFPVYRDEITKGIYLKVYFIDNFPNILFFFSIAYISLILIYYILGAIGRKL